MYRSLAPGEIIRTAEALALRVSERFPIEALPDPASIEAADDLEGLCTGLSRKIWQKAALLGRVSE